MNKIKIFLFALISSMALHADFNDIPGKYQWTAVAALAFFYVFFFHVEKLPSYGKKALWIPAILTAFFALVGKSYYLYNSSEYIWATWVKKVYFLFCLTGMGILFYYLYEMAYHWLLVLENNKKLPDRIEKILFGKGALFRLAGLILLAWLPVVVVCYPGGSCVDVSYQISQVIGRIPFSTLHPITHTLFVGFFVNLGHKIFGSYNIGLYLQILFQSVILALVMAFGMKTLYEQKGNRVYIGFLLLVDCFAPMYSNFATMTIKDTLFNTWILLYFILLYRMLVLNREEQFKIKYILPILASALGVMLFRNNGLIVVGSAGVGLTVYFLSNGIKDGKGKCLGIILYAILPILLFLAINAGLTWAFHAETYSGKEMLSIPFQQTARYIREYPEDITEQEWAVIGAVLEDEKLLGGIYDPNISDPVKRQFIETAGAKEIGQYLLVWMRLFLRHPGVYMDALLNHCYGWFDIGLRNSIRYEGRLEIFSLPIPAMNTDKLLYYWFNFWNRFPLTGVLENVGVYVWWMVLLTICLIERKQYRKMAVFLLPLYTSLVVCIASPACLLHPRYAFPILFTLPFLSGALLIPGKDRKETAK